MNQVGRFKFSERSITRMSFLAAGILSAPSRAVSMIRNSISSDTHNVPFNYIEELPIYNAFLYKLLVVFQASSCSIDDALISLESHEDKNVVLFGEMLRYEREMNWHQ